MNKITCICLGVRNMSLAIRFYRDGLGSKPARKEMNHRLYSSIHQVRSLSFIRWGCSPKTSVKRIHRKLPRALRELHSPTMWKDVKRWMWLQKKYAKQEAESRKNPRKLSGAVIMPTSPILTGIIGRWCGGLCSNTMRMVC